MSNRKADQSKLIKPDEFIESIIENVRNSEGDIYYKAALLLQSLVVSHGFASGNTNWIYNYINFPKRKHR